MNFKKKTKDWYNKNADYYSNHVINKNDSIYHHYYEKPAIRNLIPNLTKKKVLSIGCGNGADLDYLRKKGASRTVGIDLSKNLINIAKEKYEDSEFYIMDMERINFKDGEFDFAYSSLAIHYSDNWYKVFKEVSRVLKKGSYFVFSCNHPIRSAMEKRKTEETHLLELVVSKKIDKTKIDIKGDYISPRMIEDTFGEDTVNIFHVPIGVISKYAKRAGFLVEEIVEPIPKKKMKDIKPLTYEKLKKIPEFIIFKLIKK